MAPSRVPQGSRQRPCLHRNALMSSCQVPWLFHVLPLRPPIRPVGVIRALGPEIARTQPRSAGEPTKFSACRTRSEEHTSELQSHLNLVCRLLLEKKKIIHNADLA